MDNFGYVVVPFQVNEPPLKGNCSAYPLNGTAASTKFNANCTEFWDQHLPIRYQVCICYQTSKLPVDKWWKIAYSLQAKHFVSVSLVKLCDTFIIIRL